MSSVPPPPTPPPLPSQDPRFTQAHVPATPPAYSPPPDVPLPVQPIGYGTGSVTGGRPGLITAIGIVSIVIGSLAIIFNAGMGMTAFGMMMASRASRAFATAVATPPTPAPAQAGLDGDTMTAGERRAVINGLSQVRPLSPQRRRQLDALLVEGGRRMINGSGPGLTAELVAGNVSDSGLLPDAGRDRGPDFFIMGRGRLELHDDHGVFYTLDGRDPIRAAAPEPEEGEDDPLANLEADAAAEEDPASATQPAGLNARQVKAVIQHIDSLLSGQASTPKRKLTPAQTATLTTRFSDPQSGFFSPAADVAGARGQVQSAFAFPNGNVMVSTRLGNIQVDASGNVTSSFTQSSIAMGGGGGGFGFQVNEVAVLLSLLGALAGMAMAVFLIVAGALVLRQHPRGGRLHAVYAWLKIPLAIACAWAWVGMWSGVSNSAAAVNKFGGWGPRMTMLAIVLLLLGVAYPIALLLTLRARTVREYYATGIPARADTWGR